jgi:hypothetical protein
MLMRTVKQEAASINYCKTRRKQEQEQEDEKEKKTTE